MDRVRSLQDVDLPAVLGISLTATTVQRLDEIGHRIDLLRLPGDEPGWDIGNGPQAVADGQPLPLALGAALGRHYEPSDWLELALDVWYASVAGLLVTAAAEVACFCPVDHNMHAAAQAEWAVRSEAELLTAFEAGLEQLAVWCQDAVSPEIWRQRAHLPQR